MAKKKSTTNKIRLTVCGLYVAQIFFLTCGFYQFTVKVLIFIVVLPVFFTQ